MKIVDKDLDNIINERLECLSEFDPVTTTLALRGVMTVMGMTMLVTNIYNNLLSKMARACQTHTGSAKTICNLKYKIQASQAALNKCRELISKCEKTKDPLKCREKFKTQTDKYTEEIKMYNDQLRELRQYNIS